jgi:hypothetical protein
MPRHHISLHQAQNAAAQAEKNRQLIDNIKALFTNQESRSKPIMIKLANLILKYFAALQLIDEEHGSKEIQKNIICNGFYQLLKNTILELCEKTLKTTPTEEKLEKLVDCILKTIRNIEEKQAEEEGDEDNIKQFFEEISLGFIKRSATSPWTQLQYSDEFRAYGQALLKIIQSARTFNKDEETIKGKLQKSAHKKGFKLFSKHLNVLGPLAPEELPKTLAKVASAVASEIVSEFWPPQNLLTPGKIFPLATYSLYFFKIISFALFFTLYTSFLVSQLYRNHLKIGSTEEMKDLSKSTPSFLKSISLQRTLDPGRLVLLGLIFYYFGVVDSLKYSLLPIPLLLKPLLTTYSSLFNKFFKDILTVEHIQKSQANYLFQIVYKSFVELSQQAPRPLAAPPRVRESAPIIPARQPTESELTAVAIAPRKPVAKPTHRVEDSLEKKSIPAIISPKPEIFWKFSGRDSLTKTEVHYNPEVWNQHVIVIDKTHFLYWSKHLVMPILAKHLKQGDAERLFACFTHCVIKGLVPRENHVGLVYEPDPKNKDQKPLVAKQLSISHYRLWFKETITAETGQTLYIPTELTNYK